MYVPIDVMKMSEEKLLKCPNCGQFRMKTFIINYASDRTTFVYHCEACGLDGTSKQNANAITLPQEKTELPQQTQETVIHKEITMTENEDFKFREQNPKCNRSGHCCVTVLGEPKCMGVMYDEKNKMHFSLKDCKDNKKTAKEGD